MLFFYFSLYSCAGASILRITYGVTSEEENAYYVKLADLAMQSFIEGTHHGSYMVDYFPFLKYIPCVYPLHSEILLVNLRIGFGSVGSWRGVQTESSYLGSTRF